MLTTLKRLWWKLHGLIPAREIWQPFLYEDWDRACATGFIFSDGCGAYYQAHHLEAVDGGLIVWAKPKRPKKSHEVQVGSRIYTVVDEYE